MVQAFGVGPAEGSPAESFANRDIDAPTDGMDLATIIADYKRGERPFYEYELRPTAEPDTMATNCRAALAGEGSFYRYRLRLAGTHLRARSVDYFPEGQQPTEGAMDTFQLEDTTWLRSDFQPVPRREVEAALAEAAATLEPAA